MKPCNRCGAPIIWGRSEHRRDAKGQRAWIALDPEATGLGIVELKPDKTAVFAGASLDPEVKRYTPHDATCPASNTHIRKREWVT